MLRCAQDDKGSMVLISASDVIDRVVERVVATIRVAATQDGCLPGVACV
jgi:hypothetical protein